MTKIDIFSGFLGAGKTTLIKKLIQEAYQGEKLVLIENEFGEIGIDGGFLKDAGVEITEMNSGCICCSLVGDFGQALEQVLFQFHPDRILIEPSGVGKLSDVIGAVQRLDNHDIALNAFVTVADATKCKIYMKNFGELYNNQIEHAATIVLSRTSGMKEDKLLAAVNLFLLGSVVLLREHNASAPIITTPWEELSGQQILETMENKDTLKEELARLAAEQAAHDEAHHHHHHDHHHEHEHEGHDHDHEHEHEHEGHDHDHDHEHEHEGHDHDHEEHSHGHIHHHHHHHHEDGCSCDHDADEIFESWGVETPRKYSEEEITGALAGLDEGERYGIVLRAKGIVACTDGSWIHFDYVPGEQNIRRGPAGITGRLCVIGSELKEHDLDHLFCLD